MSVPRARVLPQLCCSAGGGCPGTAQQLHTCIQVNHDQANEARCFVIAEPNTTKHITNVDITALNQETEQTANSLTPPRSTNNQMHRSQAAHHQISFSSTNSVELPAPLSSPPAAQRGRYLQRCFCALSFMCASGKLCGRRNPAVWLRRCRPPAFVPGRRSPPAAAPLAQGGAVPCLRRRIGRHRGLSLRPARQRGGGRARGGRGAGTVRGGLRGPGGGRGPGAEPRRRVRHLRGLCRRPESILRRSLHFLAGEPCPSGGGSGRSSSGCGASPQPPLLSVGPAGWKPLCSSPPRSEQEAAGGAPVAAAGCARSCSPMAAASLSPLSPGSAPAGRGGASAHAARSSARRGCGARPPAPPSLAGTAQAWWRPRRAAEGRPPPFGGNAAPPARAAPAPAGPGRVGPGARPRPAGSPPALGHALRFIRSHWGSAPLRAQRHVSRSGWERHA